MVSRIRDGVLVRLGGADVTDTGHQHVDVPCPSGLSAISTQPLVAEDVQCIGDIAGVGA